MVSFPDFRARSLYNPALRLIFALYEIICQLERERSTSVRVSGASAAMKEEEKAPEIEKSVKDEGGNRHFSL